MEKPINDITDGMVAVSSQRVTMAQPVPQYEDSERYPVIIEGRPCGYADANAF